MKAQRNFNAAVNTCGEADMPIYIILLKMLEKIFVDMDKVGEWLINIYANLTQSIWEHLDMGKEGWPLNPGIVRNRKHL